MARALIRAVVVVVMVAAVVAPGAVASAQGAEEPPPPRAVPDYDQREDGPATAGEILLWVPRIVLSPVYLLAEFVIRRPIGWLVTTAELNDWPAILVDFFTFGPDRQAGIVPTALVDFGLRPSIGFYFWWSDAVADGHDLRVHAATGGTDFWLATFTNRVELSEDRTWLSLRLAYEQRVDWLFYGLGPLAEDVDESRYGRLDYGASLTFESHLWRESSVVLEAGIRATDFSDRTCCGEPSLPTQVAQGAFESLDGLPAGWDGYTKYHNRVELALDTRPERPRPGSGVRLALDGAHAFDVRRAVERRWVRYGGDLGLYWDPSGQNRVLSLTLSALFADPLGAEPIPFTELVELGGLEHMRGFVQGRLLGRSAAVATAEYRWPVWIWLDGTLHAAVGNVFGEHLRGFDPELLRLSFGLGLRSVDSRDHSFDLLLAFGSEPFDRFEINSVRVLFGTTRGL